MIPRRLAAVAALGLGLIVFWDGARHSPLFSPAERDRRVWLSGQVRGDGRDMAEEGRLAEVYWTRYPDVAADPHYGRTSRLGVSGAREHYNQHGRKEGRIWG